MNPTTNRAITVSLNALCARNEATRNGRAAREAAAIRGPGGRRHSSDSAASPVRAGIASSRPLKTSMSEAPVTSAIAATSDWGPTGYPHATALGSGPKPFWSQSVQKSCAAWSFV